MRRFILPFIAALAVMSGCGGGSQSEGGDAPEGSPKATFASTCGSCHTLGDAGTAGSFGPNLDELAPDEARVRTAIAEGPGSMPGGLLDGATADAVAAYVSSVAGSDG